MIIKLAALFSGLAKPLARKVLSGLGFGVISYAGVTVAFSAAVTLAQNNYNNIGTDILALAGLGGLGEGIGIIVGALTFRIGFTSLSKLGILPK